MKNKIIGRPEKKKKVCCGPRAIRFSPRGRPGRPDEVVIDIAGYEAIRLADHLDMTQKAGAAMMGVSQQSFSRIVRSARRSVADAIVNAKILRIEDKFPARGGVSPPLAGTRATGEP